MNAPIVTIIDYGMGNVWSVMSAFKYLGAKAELVSDPEQIASASILVLPGVGSFRNGMKSLSNRGIDKAIIEAVNSKEARILGICLGMQLLGSNSTECGETDGVGLLPNKVDKFSEKELQSRKIPHVGFNSIHIKKKEGLFKNLPDQADFYFTHSYRMISDDSEESYATCKYGIEFLAAYQIGNVCGAQFHPEKSQTNGLIMLKNFIEL